jgi:hypothetical protein
VGIAFGLPKGRISSVIEQNEMPELSSEYGQEGKGLWKDNT